jgi:DNA-binding LytR/AlgR family response regulator
MGFSLCPAGGAQAERKAVHATSIRTLIVDDEPIARQVLRDELEVHPDFEVVGEATHGEEALELIGRLKPDLVFLDLQMPLIGGFEVIRRLQGGKLPIVIIVTAFDQHAIQAFEAGAVDYLLKPVNGERLARALDRARHLQGKSREIAERLSEIVAAAPEPPAGTRPRKIVGRAGDEYYLLDLDEVLAFQAERELVWIIAARRRYLATEPLRTIEEKLQGLPFQRVHRNAIVNVNHVRKMSALSSQRWMLTLDSGQELIVSKRQAHAVRQMLRW